MRPPVHRPTVARSRRPFHSLRSLLALGITGLALALAGMASGVAAGPDPATGPDSAAHPGPAAPVLPTVDPATIARALDSIPAPSVPGLAALQPAVADDAVAHDAPGAAGRPSADSPSVAEEISVLDTFERTGWPNYPPYTLVGGTRWVPPSLTDLRRPTDGYRWSTSPCQKAAGTRSLCPVCAGGAPGTPHPCGGQYPADTAPSILLLLDLSRKQNVDRLELVMDIWPDAPSDEGLLVNYVAYDRSGEVAERRTVFSATGRLRGWAYGQRIDLLNLRDVRDPGWHGRLAGQVAYLEFLFLSHGSPTKGEGLYIDNLTLVSQPATVAVTPAPLPTSPPSSNARNCPAGATCGTLQVEAYVDYQCNGRFQPGVDRRLAGLWVDVVAGSTPLRAILSPSGSAFFYLPVDADVTVTTELPPQHKMCANSPNPLTLHPADFGRYRRKKVTFRMVEAR